MRISRVAGNFEIALGLFLVAFASVLMVQSSLDGTRDPHGWALVIGFFGTGIGGLLSFAGLATRQSAKLGVLAHIPVIAFIGISCFVYIEAF